MFSYIRLPGVTVEFRGKFQTTTTWYMRRFVEEHDQCIFVFKLAVDSKYIVILSFASIK